MLDGVQAHKTTTETTARRTPREGPRAAEEGGCSSRRQPPHLSRPERDCRGPEKSPTTLPRLRQDPDRARRGPLPATPGNRPVQVVGILTESENLTARLCLADTRLLCGGPICGWEESTEDLADKHQVTRQKAFPAQGPQHRPAPLRAQGKTQREQEVAFLE